MDWETYSKEVKHMMAEEFDFIDVDTYWKEKYTFFKELYN